MAEAFYRRYTEEKIHDFYEAASAGLADGVPEVGSIHAIIYRVMGEVQHQGKPQMTLEKQYQKQLIPALVERADLVISLASEKELKTKTERERWEWAHQKPFAHWPVKDCKGEPLDAIRATRDEIDVYAHMLAMPPQIDLALCGTFL